MVVLLDEDEKAQQQAFLFGPPPLGPGAPPLERLLAYGHARHTFLHDHHALTALLDADYLVHRLAGGATLDEVADAWEGVAVELCGR